MELETAKLIREQNPDEINIREDYSGRFMYGETTAAVTGDSNVVECAIDDLLTDCGDDFDYNDESNELSEKLRSLRRDSMGLGVVYY